MKLPKDYTREELDKILIEMAPESVMFLRAMTARVVRALAEEEPIIVMFPEPEQEEIEIYSKGLESGEVYHVLIEAADIMLDTQSNSPAPMTQQ